MRPSGSARPHTSTIAPCLRRPTSRIQEYPYFVPETHLVDEDAMLAQVEKLGKGDVLLLHGCCHNPTGADISLDTWARIAELANLNGFLPFVDMAYQGFGDGLDEDADGMHILENSVEEMIIATSCSKNFGLYRERTGAAILIGPTKEKSMNGEQRLLDVLVSTYIMPPDHGAAIVDMILRNAALKAAWIAELDEIEDPHLDPSRTPRRCVPDGNRQRSIRLLRAAQGDVLRHGIA